jgi:putative restriction endonuclease
MVNPERKYFSLFRHLRIDKAHGIAPHKPILLLSVIDEIECGNITSNRIFITPELVARFKENWGLLASAKYEQRFALPFYHLRSDKFWKLIPNIGYERMIGLAGQMRNFKSLNEAVNHAEIDQELFEVLQDEKNRNDYRTTLLKTYFSNTNSRYFKAHRSYIEKITDKILSEPAIDYRAEIIAADDEEIFVRSNIFKRVVPKVYNYKCCISELRIDVAADISMVDACHIVPFSISHDDTITNGISLCPNLHRAFDRGLFTIGEDFRVIVSDGFSEVPSSEYGIKKFAGKMIAAPSDKMFYPLLQNLQWHKENKFQEWLKRK